MTKTEQQYAELLTDHRPRVIRSAKEHKRALAIADALMQKRKLTASEMGSHNGNTNWSGQTVASNPNANRIGRRTFFATAAAATAVATKGLSQNPNAPTPNPSSATADLRPEDGGGGFGMGTKSVGRDYGPDAPPVRYPDPDIVVIDKRFAKYKLGNTPILRLYHSQRMLWAEGPAWSGVGRYLLWSDIPNNVQLRWLAEDGHVSRFRHPSGNSNGNTFDWQGRQVSCEHGNRRVVRYEPDGTITVLADKFGGKPFNAPNDVVVHPEDGGIWFTDPGYGSMVNYEGNKGPLLLKEAVYRIDAGDGTIAKVTDEIEKPNGLCFSPDYKMLYVADTGAPKNIKVWNLADGKRLENGRPFVSMTMELGGKAVTGLADGIRCDVDGNVWASAGWVGDEFDGVHVFAPDGTRIGQIRLPEICSNLCFGGRKRNRLFMTASTSLYAVYVATQGAHIP